MNTDTEYDVRGRVSRTSEPYFDGLSPSWNTSTYNDSNRVTGMSAADNTQNSTTSYIQPIRSPSAEEPELPTAMLPVR